MKRAYAHVRTLWPGPGALLPLPFLGWLAWCLSQGDLRWELFGIALGMTALLWWSERTKGLALALLPLGLLALVYDSMRFVKDLGLTTERVHDCDLRALDMRLLTVNVDGRPGTIHDWFQVHPSTVLDVLCAIPYGTFLGAAVACAVFLYVRDRRAVYAFGWTLLLLNIAGFVTYHVYPAAPPWYFHTHGCAVDLAARASEGARLANVDALLGIAYFGGFYGRSQDVFGAVPSLHVAYPLLIVLHGYRHFGPVLRVASGGYFLAMAFAAVYLDHHWIVDVLLGVVYTLAIDAAVRAVLRWQKRGEPDAVGAVTWEPSRGP